MRYINLRFTYLLTYLSQLTHFKLYSFRFKFRREVFLEGVNS